ncbi:hypothetical protein Tco_0087908 [Tanacetum coccineum]
MAPTTRRGPNTPVNDTNPNNMTPESVQAMIDQALLRNSTNGDGSHSSHGDNRRNVQTARPCFYADFMKCQPLNFKGAEGVVGLTRWIEKMESVFNISGCAVENQVKFATCTLLGAALTWWNGQIRTLDPLGPNDGFTIGCRDKCPNFVSFNKIKDGGNGMHIGWVYAVWGMQKKRGNARKPCCQCLPGYVPLKYHPMHLSYSTPGADRKHLSTAFSSLINIAPTPLENCYDVELADGKLVGIDTII